MGPRRSAFAGLGHHDELWTDRWSKLDCTYVVSWNSQASMPTPPMATNLVFGASVAFMVYSFLVRRHKCLSKHRHIRQKLPLDLSTWRCPGASVEAEERVWNYLDPVLRDCGYDQWQHSTGSVIRRPAGSLCLSSGFSYATPGRGIGDQTKCRPLGTVAYLGRFEYNVRFCFVNLSHNIDNVVIRVMVIKNEGYEHLALLKRIAMGPYSLLSDNHTLPMHDVTQFEDIHFGIFPLVGAQVREAFGSWAKNSVGDVLDMLLQALEGLAFLYKLNIAHRDAFHDNLVVQWHPESCRSMTIPVSRPRVYLIDFEVAVQYPSDRPATSIGYPVGGSFLQPEMYSRDRPPELESDRPYCPYKLDVWQLGHSFSNFKTTIDSIDTILLALTEPDAERRMDAETALSMLSKEVFALTPELYLLEPEVEEL
ncbi:hypothetical protein B0H10DRAFT_349223 [Mycena sp. CBHHK59/15]|nr:hypothetical protein B0H10DRAFT_349223 [Mycena sp. CBHHK59/15]